MHNTPPQLPVPERDTEELVNDLCVALRNVGVFDYELPNGPRVSQAINDVRTIKRELDHRGIDVADRLTALSAQTCWQMAELLRDCLSFPAVSPYVRERDGVRRELRCSLCQKAERPMDAQRFLMCNECIGRILQCIRSREPAGHTVLFRTYNSVARCEHANDDTVLALDPYTDSLFGYCERCFQEELNQRMRSVPPPQG